MPPNVLRPGHAVDAPRLPQLPRGAASAPTATAAMIATLIAVSTVLSAPPALTFMQLSAVNSTITPIATGTSPTPRSNDPCANVAAPTAYAAIEPGVAIQ